MSEEEKKETEEKKLQSKDQEKPAEKEERKPQDLVVSVPPHIWQGESTNRIMFWVVAALLPTTLYAIYLYRLQGLMVISLCIASCAATEAVYQKLQKLPVNISDGSAILTGLLLALTLPPMVPWWIAVIGGIVAILLGKQLFGGLGYNIFNPALVGRAVLVLSWAKHMSKDWYAPLVKIDAKTLATPLFAMKQVRLGILELDPSKYYQALFLSNPGGCIGEVSALLLLIGAAILLIKKIIDWRIPVSYLGTVLVLTVILKGDPVFYLLAGGLVLGAFFMATDYVTSPITGRGKLIFGAGCGIVTVLLRFYSGLPEAVMFSILFMNACAPLIDRYTRPRVFGTVKAK